MTETGTTYQESINQGHSAAWDQDWERAASFYKAAISEKPDDPNAINNLALALFELGDFSESLNNYLRVIELTPDDPGPMEKAATLYEILKKPEIGSKVAIQAAELYLAREDIDKALENWSRSVAMNPENIIAHSRLAVVYERLNRIPQAVREYLHIASLMQHEGDREKAVQVVNRALKLNPQDDEASQALTMINDNIPLPKPSRPQGGTGQLSEATLKLLEEPDTEPTQDSTPVEEASQKALADLAALFFEQSTEDFTIPKPHTGGLSAIVDGTGPLYAKNVDKNQLMLHLGQVVESLTSGENEQAEVDLEQVIEIGLHHPAAYFYLGLIRMNNNRLESAIRHLKRAVSHMDYSLGSRLLLAEGYQHKEDIISAAIESLEALKFADCLLVSREHSDSLRQLYEPLIEAQEQTTTDDGCENICNTVADMLQRPDWRQHIKDVRKELFQFDDGTPRPIAEILTEAYSSQVVVALGEIRQLARDGRRIAAVEEAFFALNDAPTYLPLHTSIAELLLSGNQIQAAVEKLLVIARSYSVRGETGRAIDILKRVVEISPMDIEARRSLVDQLVSRGQAEDAAQEYINMAEVYYSMAELTEARKTYTRALRFVEQSGLGESWQIRILHCIADIDVQSLNWRQGLTIYQKILKSRPDDIDANRSLIDLNFRLGERTQALTAITALINTLNAKNRIEDAISFIEKLIEDWPEQAVIKESLADQYIKLGRNEDAIKQLEAARSIFFAAQDKESSIYVIKKIIDLNPRNITKYQQLLERIQLN